MSEDTVDTIAKQMLQFILEQAPMFMLVIIALLLVLGVIYTLVKLGLVSTKSETAPTAPKPLEDFDGEYHKAVLVKLGSIEQTVKDLDDNLTHTREVVVTLMQAQAR